MSNITRGEYLNALELIDNYHRQSQDVIKEKTLTVAEWIGRNNVKGRLRSVLVTLNLGGLDYIDDIKPYHIANCHNIGPKTVQEFKILKGIEDE